MVESVVYTEIGSRNQSGSYNDCTEVKQVKHFVNKSMGKRYIVYLLKLYYSKLPDVEIDLHGDSQVIYASTTCSIQLFTSHVIVVSIFVVSMFCHKYLFQY